MSLDGTDRASELARATAEHLKHDGFSVLEKGVSVDRVAELMYISRSAVHSSLIRLGKRGSDNGLLRNLSEHWLDPDRTGATRQLAEAMKQGVVETPDADPVETIKAMCDVYFTEVSTQPVAQVQLSLWLGRDDPDVAKRLQNIYSDLDMIVADPVSYTHLRAPETVLDTVCRLLLEKKKKHHTPTIAKLSSTHWITL